MPGPRKECVFTTPVTSFLFLLLLHLAQPTSPSHYSAAASTTSPLVRGEAREGEKVDPYRHTNNANVAAAGAKVTEGLSGHHTLVENNVLMEENKKKPRLEGGEKGGLPRSSSQNLLLPSSPFNNVPEQWQQLSSHSLTGTEQLQQGEKLEKQLAAKTDRRPLITKAFHEERGNNVSGVGRKRRRRRGKRKRRRRRQLRDWDEEEEIQKRWRKTRSRNRRQVRHNRAILIQPDGDSSSSRAAPYIPHLPLLAAREEGRWSRSVPGANSYGTNKKISGAEVSRNSTEDPGIGGLNNHIPGFSSSEEKLLEYDNYDYTSTVEGLLDTGEAEEEEDDDNSPIILEPTDEDIAQLEMEEEEEEEREDDEEFETIEDTIEYEEPSSDLEQAMSGSSRKSRPRLDIVTKLLRIVESQALQGANCTPGTDLNLGDKVVNRYAQERFHSAALVAVNLANWFTRMWKYAPDVIGVSEYLLHTTLFSMIEFDEDIFAAGNCYDAEEYKNYFLFCPFAYRLPEGQLLAKDLAIEYKYLSNTSEWFFQARKKAEEVILNAESFKTGRTVIHLFRIV